MVLYSFKHFYRDGSERSEGPTEFLSQKCQNRESAHENGAKTYHLSLFFLVFYGSILILPFSMAAILAESEVILISSSL